MKNRRISQNQMAKEMVPKGFPAYHFFTASGYRDMIENAGFRVIERGPNVEAGVFFLWLPL